MGIKEIRDVVEILRNEIELDAGVADDHTEFKVNEITENGQTKGRNHQTMINHTKTGTILEMALVKALDGKMNTNVFDKTDPETYAWDVEAYGLRFEVKSSPKNDKKWFNFNLDGYENYSETKMTRANLTTFLKHPEYSDFVVAGYYTDLGDKYLVKFKWLMVSEVFEEFVKRSNPNSVGTTHYFHTVEAERAKRCVIL